MKVPEILNSAKYVYDSFSGEESLLENWIYDHAEEISAALNSKVSKEEIEETIGDTKARKGDFYKISASITKIIDKYKPINRIELKDDTEGTYVKLTELGRTMRGDIENELWTCFTRAETWTNKMRKGIFYEEFCTLFLEDLGLTAERTKASGDKGIDIQAFYKTTLSEDLSKYIFKEDIYLLGQAKFFSTAVDTPVIRKLVGDSLFLRFDQLSYVKVAHNAIHLIIFGHKGFTEDAIEFADKNKVMRVETRQIISIISAAINPEKWKCYQYLKTETGSQDRSILEGSENGAIVSETSEAMNNNTAEDVSSEIKN